MKCTAKLFIDEEFLTNLFDLDVEKGEINNLEDAIFCEMRFNAFDFIL